LLISNKRKEHLEEIKKNKKQKRYFKKFGEEVKK
jgi:hypothetical protein